MTVYLFCNQRYGMPFVETAARFAAENNAAIRVVMSAGRRNRTVRRTRRRLTSPLRRWLMARRKARRWGIPVSFVPDVNSARFRASIGSGDCGVIAGFNQIFEPATIECFRSLVNFHPSLLPLYRGPVPSHWCLANGETTTGFTLHEVTEKIDAGRFLHQQEVPIQPDDDTHRLDRRIGDAATPVLWRWLKHCHNDAPWNPLCLDAESVYRVPVDYATFPAAA